MSASEAAGPAGGHWAKLDRRTVLVTAILLLGVAIGAGVPAGFLIAENNSLRVALLRVVPAGLVLVAGGAAWDYLRWRRTSYRVGPERVELHTGLLIRRRRSVHRDRIRSVDVTADPLSRLFGLSQVKVGTGQQAEPGGSSVVLRPVTTRVADELRSTLLDREPEAGVEQGTIAGLNPSWARYAPMSFLSPLLGLSAFGVVLKGADWFGLQGGVIDWGLDLFRGLPLAATITILGALAVVIGVLGSFGLFVEMWWRFRLDREAGGTLRVRRGLLTTRSISLEEKRLRGIELVEPLGTRLVGAARLDAVATGMARQDGGDRTDHKTLLPAAPRGVADRVAADVLRENESPTAAALSGHPLAARERRLRWALAAVFVVEAVLVVLGAVVTEVLWHVAWVGALVLIPVAVLLALDAYRSLGHAVAGRYLVVRSGTVRRGTVALQRAGIIGWTVKQSIFQRRAGLLTLTATTAAGIGAYSAYDVDTGEALAFAESAVPELFTPFLDPME